jgi:hypothetical protein
MDSQGERRGQGKFSYKSKGTTHHPTSDHVGLVAVAECQLCCGYRHIETKPIGDRFVAQLQAVLEKHGNVILFFKSRRRTLQVLDWAQKKENVSFEVRLWRRVWLSPRYLHSDECFNPSHDRRDEWPKCDNHSLVSISYCMNRRAYTCYHCGYGFMCLFNITLWCTDNPCVAVSSAVGIKSTHNESFPLPLDVLVKILFSFSLRELASVSRVCQAFYYAARRRELLRSKLSTEFPHPKELISPLLAKRAPFCKCESDFIKHRHV